MPSSRYAPCPHCARPNLGHRRECWSCKGALPVSFSLAAARYQAPAPRPRAVPLAPAAAAAAEQMAMTKQERQPIVVRLRRATEPG